MNSLMKRYGNNIVMKSMGVNPKSTTRKRLNKSKSL
jgi:hypothetical protein